MEESYSRQNNGILREFMLKTAFLSRVAFLCNCCLVLTWLLRYLPAIEYGGFIATIIIAGLVLSFIVNGLVNILYAGLLLRRRLSHYVPVWLAVVNFLFLIVQFYLIVHDP